MRAIPCGIAVAVLCVGCGASVQDRFGDRGFYHRDYAYRIDYLNRSDRSLLPPDWQLDNFQVRDGQLQDYKRGRGWVETIRFDTDDDGATDAAIELYTYDLLFEHRRHDGLIWLRSFPVSPDVGERSLEVLAENYVEGVSGTGYVVSRLEPVVVGERRYGTRVIDSASGTVAGARAHRITFDVVNLDQQEADPSTAPTRVRIYLIHAPYPWVWGAGATREGAFRRGAWPLLMVAGYVNDAHRFAEDEGALESLLARLAFRHRDGSLHQGLSGFDGPATAGAAGGPGGHARSVAGLDTMPDAPAETE